MSDFNAEIVQGDDVDLIINVKDKANAVIDLSGVTDLTFKARLKATNSLNIDKDLSSGVAVTDAPNGQITVTLTNVDTSKDNLPQGDYSFEAQITDSVGKISTVRDFNDALGTLKVLPDLD